MEGQLIRVTHLISYESVCLIAACWLLSNNEKLISAAMLILSLLAWISNYGAQFQESNKIHSSEEL